MPMRREVSLGGSFGGEDELEDVLLELGAVVRHGGDCNWMREAQSRTGVAVGCVFGLLADPKSLQDDKKQVPRRLKSSRDDKEKMANRHA